MLLCLVVSFFAGISIGLDKFVLYDHDDTDGYASSLGYVRMSQSMLTSTYKYEFVDFMQANSQTIKALKSWEMLGLFCCLFYGGGPGISIDNDYAKAGSICRDLTGNTAYSITSGPSGPAVTFTYTTNFGTHPSCVYGKSPAIWRHPSPNSPTSKQESVALLSRGYNLFKNELSGSNILDPNYLANNTEYVSSAESFCKYSSLEFNSAFSSYESYAKSDSESISLGFSTEKFAAAGSYSQSRIEARTNARSSQSSIYSISLECVVMQASINGPDQLHWNEDFIKALRILPRAYRTGDDLSYYIDFWDDYGTHLLLTAKLGGSIRGSVVTDKCSVYESYGESKEYQTCLSGAYKGVSVAGCKGDGDSSLTSSSIESTIINKQITVRGGASSQYSGILHSDLYTCTHSCTVEITEIFQTFGDKESDFSAWINGLEASPYVIGGNTNEIHDVIRAAALLGGHRLGPSLEDEDILNIASAMKAAFRDYAAEIETESHSFDLGECSVDCMEGVLDAEKCICQNCKNECCGSDATKLSVKYGAFMLIVFHVFTQLYY